MRYWIVVASKDHIARGVAGGFIQANHGKASPLRKMSVNDGVICYSPKETYEGKQPLQAFTAIGRIADDRIYEHKMADDFIPYRRNVEWYKCRETPIALLSAELDFIKDKKSWGYQFRFGFFEIPEADFKLIFEKMVDLH